MSALRHVLAALEQHVLEKVRESAPALSFVARADVVRDRHGYRWASVGSGFKTTRSQFASVRR